MRLALVAIALLLAGCARDAPAVVAGEPVYGDVPEFVLRDDRAPLVWHALHESAFAMTSATPLNAGVTIPPRALQVLVNLTLDEGAAFALTIALGECTWRRDVALVGNGATIGADCGGLDAGADAVAIGIDVGALVGTARVVALVCEPTPERGSCPAPAPVGS